MFTFGEVMTIAVRDVDENVFREFKAEAVREGVSVGKILTMAMRLWMERVKKKKKVKRSLLDLKPFDWGEGTENSSEEIDATLYGE